MKHTPENISIRDLVDGYEDKQEEGVRGFKQQLNIRPPYQREFVYNDVQRDLVIDSVRKKYPLNTIYWVKNSDGTYEVLDGQQRIISICRFAAHKPRLRFHVKDPKLGVLYFQSLPENLQEEFLNYKLSVYICEGSESDKMEWFKRINVVGEKLTDQELRNALFHGDWVTAAKKKFSRIGGPAHDRSSMYVSARAERQEYLETALRWYRNDNDRAAKGDTIQACMSRIHSSQEPAEKLWKFYEGVIDWIEDHFPQKYWRKEMKGVAWGELYREYKKRPKDPEKTEELVSELMKSEDVQNGKGIYTYVFTRDSRDLTPRAFHEADKRRAYEKQGGKCNNPNCGKEFPRDKMQADHKEPWSWGGPSVEDNCQMLCKPCHNEKSKLQGRIAADN